MSTLFSYFKPVQDKKDDNAKSKSKNLTPKLNGNDQENKEPLPTPHQTPLTSRKRTSQTLAGSSDDSEGEIGVRRKANKPKHQLSANRGRKKKKIFESDEDSDEDYQVPPTLDESEEYSFVMETDEDGSIMETTPSRKTNLIKSTPKTAPRTPSVVATPTLDVSKSSLMDTPTHQLNTSLPVTPLSAPSTPSLYLHQKLNWLKDESIKDKSGHRLNHPDYNPRTLLVPPQFLSKCTPAMKQWWVIKSENYDTILFFKVGKFYELYHMDAEVGVKELGLVFMKGEFAHSGFPEVAFGRYSQTLVQRGYKVARVEQTETPQMLEQRVKKSSFTPKSDKVVKRELCSLITKGTRTIGFFEDSDPPNVEAAFLLCIKEKPHSQAEHEFGVCFVDTCIGTFHLGQFTDDRQCSRLRTLLAHHPPAQVLIPRKNLSFRSSQILHQLLPNSMHDILSPGSEFWEASKTLQVLKDECLFGEVDEGVDHADNFPAVLRSMLSEGDSMGLSPSDSYDLAISSLGACVWMLKRCQIEKQLLNMKNFEEYIPVDNMGVWSQQQQQQGDVTICNPDLKRQRMVLDDITLQNLDVLDNNGADKGTLLQVVDHCLTSFGKRLLKQWMCSPPCDPIIISLRQDAVSDLIANHALLDEIKEILKTLPDMERLLRRVFVMGYKHQDNAHPECRAILYEETTYSKKKIVDFLSLLNGFQASVALPTVFASYKGNCDSKILHRLLTLSTNGGKFPDMTEKISFFEKAFDHSKAHKDGVIIPENGVNTDYDEAVSGVTMIEDKLDNYLQRQKKRLGCKSIVYWGNARNRYQLEVPESVISSNMPDDYDLKSQRKGFRRYWTKEIESLLETLVQYEEQRDATLKDTMRTVFHRFGDDFQMWESAVECLAILDVLASMATYSSGSDFEMCRPDVVTSSIPFLDLRGGRHPCVVQTFTGDSFIPNDVQINPERTPGGGSCLVVTGPNMGGKSTLMRQTGLIVILGQLGCFVPAESCSFSPIDRIFTRLGASDRIIQGESTFFVELSETAVILQHGTPDSLVLLDELGRGTATHDGTAIAGAVVSKIVRDIGCRTMFSTHYHSLVDELSHDPHVTLGHMSCMVEEGDDDGEECVAEECITFLYKFVEGVCPKSYGFNAARLAGLPNEVIQLARGKASQFELNFTRQKLFRQLVNEKLTKDMFCELMSEL